LLLSEQQSYQNRTLRAYESMLIQGRLSGLTNLLVTTILSIGLFGVGGSFFARSNPVLIDYV